MSNLNQFYADLAQTSVVYADTNLDRTEGEDEKYLLQSMEKKFAEIEHKKEIKPI